MLISINIDTELYSPRAITDLRETESLLRRMWPELTKDASRPCPAIEQAALSEAFEPPAGEQPAAGPEAPSKPRRGRPRKEAAPAAVEVVNPPDAAKFSEMLETLRAQLTAAEKTPEQIDAAIKEWVERGVEALAELRATVEKNAKFLAEVAAAKVKAEETRQGVVEEPKAPGLDKLRDALTTYVNSTDMKAGLQLLRDFGCARISEMESKPVTDQLEFIKLANKPVSNA